MDQALEKKNGIRAKIEGYGEAMQYRSRMNYARVLDRRSNAEIYPDPGHHLHNKSDYDELVFRLIQIENGDSYWLYVMRRPKPTVIEEIDKVEEPKLPKLVRRV